MFCMRKTEGTGSKDIYKRKDFLINKEMPDYLVT